MKAIVFIGSNKSGSSYEAIKSSELMQYYTVLLTNRVTGYPNAHLIKLCDINSKKEIKQIIDSLIKRDLDIRAIVSFLDPHCHTAAVLSKEYGLNYFSVEAILAMQDKIESRKKLAESPYVPLYYIIDDHNTLTPKLIKNKLPLVLKNPKSTGSNDVYKTQTYAEYIDASEELIKRYPNDPILVEEFLDGPQFLVETLTVNEKTFIIAIIEQEITFAGKFIVTGYKIILDHNNEFYQSLKEATKSIIRLHGMKDGPCHLEIRFVNHNWKLIEINPRISGGAMNLFIETAYGINLAKETLMCALGVNPNFEYEFERETFLQYVIVPEIGMLTKITGKNNALNSQGVEHVYVKPKKGSIVIPPISMGYRYAYVIATGKTANEARRNGKIGASKIKFHLRKLEISESLSTKQKESLNIFNKNKSNIKSTDSYNFYNNLIIE